MAIYKPARMANSEYKHRTIQRKETTTQLRILACFQSSRTVPSLINLMEVSRGTGKRGGLRVYAMHLMELSERSSAILMVHKARNNGLPFFNKEKATDTTQVVVAFEAFQQLSHVSIRPTTAISPAGSPAFGGTRCHPVRSGPPTSCSHPSTSGGGPTSRPGGGSSCG